MKHVIDMDEPVIVFSLIRYHKPGLRTLAYLGLDRWKMRQASGVRFWRLLGVGRGKAFAPHADLQRSAIFSVWRSYTDARRFAEESTLMQRVRGEAKELWTVYMRPIRWHGAWGGRDPLSGVSAAVAPDTGPWVILTRATLRPARVKAFLDAVPAVAAQLLSQPSLLNSVGFGELPLLYQATLSVWQTLPDVTAFAYGQAPHREVIRRTRQEGWYREEFFARFRPLEATGTWDGANPLAPFNMLAP